MGKKEVIECVFMKDAVKVGASIREHWLWQQPDKLKWWLDMCLMAATEEHTIMVGNKEVTLKRGQFVSSIKDFCDRWGRGHDMVIAFLKIMEQQGLITRTCNNRIPLVTINAIFSAEEQEECSTAFHGKTDKLPDRLADKLPDRLGTYLTEEETMCYGEAILQSCTSWPTSLPTIQNEKETEKEIFPPYNPLFKEKDKEKEKDSGEEAARAREGQFGESLFSGHITPQEEAYFAEMRGSQFWQENICMRHNITRQKCAELIELFRQDTICTQRMHRSRQEALTHFSQWVRIQLDQERKRDMETRRNMFATMTAAERQEYEYQERQRKMQEFIARKIERGIAKGTVRNWQ